MREEMWQLYRHLILGGIIIVVCCYSVMEFIQIRLDTFKTEQLLCVDAEISSAILLSGVSSQVPESQFSWLSSLPEPLPISEVSSLIAIQNWRQPSENSYQLTIGPSDKALLSGLADDYNQFFRFESLLERLLMTDKISYLDKISLVENMSCLSIEKVPSEVLSPLTGVALIHGAYYKYGFLWQDRNIDRSVYLSIVHEDNISLTLVVVTVVTVVIIIMLLLMCRELIALDSGRKKFESVTRQIARGRSALSSDISDSSGTLKELAYSFDSMSSHIERLLKVQREMTNAISHELRTPIARLRFGLEVMKDEVDYSVAPTIEALEGDVEELNTLVDEVLTYGKLEVSSLELNFSEFSIYQLINDILQHNRLLLQHLTVDLNISETDFVLADEHHLSRALQNLILNASKYAENNIIITFSYDSDRWQLDIEDDGPGIAFEDRDKVFIPFQRLDNSRTRASGGYGLGLAIVQRIAFWHGGAVLIDASESGGAKFSLIWSRNQHQKTLS